MSPNFIIFLFPSLYIFINLVAFFAMGADKKRSMDNNERIKETNLFLWAIFFGSAGVLAGMLYFHHKTRKFSFIFGVTALLLQQIALFYMVFNSMANIVK